VTFNLRIDIYISPALYSFVSQNRRYAVICCTHTAHSDIDAIRSIKDLKPNFNYYDVSRYGFAFLQ